MKAIVYERYGAPDVLELKEVAKPAPRDNEVLIRVRATTVTAGDWRARSLQLPAGFGPLGRLVFGFTRPRQPVLGTELAGEVEAVGRDVRAFRVGDHVFAYAGAGMGCHAEYKCMPEDAAVARKPANLTWEEAAAMSFGGTTALSFFRRARLQRGERVLIVGASGGVGTAAVQLARHFGAEVTGVCSTANVELVRSLGANRVMDYTKEDFLANGGTYDVIVDTTGTAPFSRSQHALGDGGRLLLVLAGLGELLQAPWVSLTSNKKVIAGPAAGSAEELRFLAALAEAGEFKPVIDRRYPFEQMADAHRHVDTGHKRGNVIVTLAA
ncbi:MAG: NAD(P)-dependent alcohol dehydrogenase [Myxococcota bacterium]